MNALKSQLYTKIIEDYNTGNFKLKDLSQKYGIRYDTISKNIRKLGIITNPHGKIRVNSNIFEKIDTEEKAYWLGFLYADGSVQNHRKHYLRLELGLQERDLNHIEKFKEFISSKHSIAYRESSKSHRIIFSDSKLCNDLVKLGCIPNKSLILKFPTEEQVPKEFISHFIRGYFDGDGYLSKPPKALTISLLGTLEFLNELTRILKKLNITTNVLKKDKRILSNTFYFDLCGDKARNFLSFIYNDSTVSLDRKKQLFNKIPMKMHYKPIIQYDLENNIIAEYYNGTEASKLTGISHPQISRACYNKTMIKKKYKFLFKEI